MILVLMAMVWFYFREPPAVHKISNVKCQTTKGVLDIVVMNDWGPRGAARFLQLVDDGFYTGLPFFRCMDQFICQFGAAVPKPNAKAYSPIPDDMQRADLRNFHRGYLSFAGSGPNTRSTHAFISFGDIPSLGANSWETPFGYLAPSSMETLSLLTTVYGEMAPGGQGPDPQKIAAPDGAAYLKKNFPRLDYFVSCARN